MGYYVHLSVIFSCNENEPVAKIAKRHLEEVEDCFEAQMFLKELSVRTGWNPGPKGGLSLWGITGNYTSPDHFVEKLHPFWLDLFRSEGGPLDFEHIIVFCEPEQREYASCHEISYDEDTDKLEIKGHVLPFAWMQM